MYCAIAKDCLLTLVKSRLALGSPGCDCSSPCQKWPNTQENGCWLLPSGHIQSENLFQIRQYQKKGMNGPASLLHSWRWVLLYCRFQRFILEEGYTSHQLHSDLFLKVLHLYWVYEKLLNIGCHNAFSYFRARATQTSKKIANPCILLFLTPTLATSASYYKVNKTGWWTSFYWF